MSLFDVRQPRVVRLSLVAAFTLWTLSLPAYAALIDVEVMIQGIPGLQKIGTIDAQSGPANDTDHLTAKFSFIDPFKGTVLDDCYDFQWINVVTGKVGDDSPLFDAYPNIDPQAPPKNAAEDDEPYYYHQANEWDTGLFGAEVIRTEGDFSLFSDSPQRGLGNGFTFNTFLVAQDLHGGFMGDKFSILAGFSWTYTGGTAGNVGEDVSTFGAAIPINAAVVAGVNAALGNEANDTFDDWTALGPQTLVLCAPEPGSVSLMGLGTLSLLGLGYRRRRQSSVS
jgi:hypothetical protein